MIGSSFSTSGLSASRLTPSSSKIQKKPPLPHRTGTLVEGVVLLKRRNAPQERRVIANPSFELWVVVVGEE